MTTWRESGANRVITYVAIAFAAHLVFVDQVFAQADALTSSASPLETRASTVHLAAADKDAEAAEPREDTEVGSKISGYHQFEGAYTTASPDHGSKLKNRLELAATGTASAILKWKLSGGFWYDAIFNATNFYLPDVRHDQRFDAIARENYLDLSLRDFDIRLGRQHIVWGEVVSLFVADVVSAKDLREFVLPDFDLVRIPQWAARGEYFKNDFHAEAIWVPVITFDNIGKPGADFYPYPPRQPPGYSVVIENEHKPSNSLENSAYGMRASYVKNGWDGSLFYYRSIDAMQTFFRSIVVQPVPTLVFRPGHERIWQSGGTLSKDFDTFIFKAEAVYTANRNYSISRLDDLDGVVKQDALDYILALDFALPSEGRLNLQFFQRLFRNHDPDIGLNRVESDVSVLVSGNIGSSLVPELLLVSSLNRSDWMVRPKLTWTFARNWRLAGGADIFGGSPAGFFGRFGDKDRVYAELRYSF
jgi:hypothetical protein